MLLKLILEILIWKLKRITQNVVKVLEQDIGVILPALAGRHDIGLVENGRRCYMKTLLSFIFVFGLMMTLGCQGDKPVACALCAEDCPCVEADCVCDIDICKCENCIS